MANWEAVEEGNKKKRKLLPFFIPWDKLRKLY
jgi:hypothetical protein